MTTNDKIIVNVSNGLAFLALTLCLAIGAGLAGFIGFIVALPVGMVAMIAVGIKVQDALSLYYFELEQVELAQSRAFDDEIEVIDLDT
jgi:predicted PurR-regulated permease PerM